MNAIGIVACVVTSSLNVFPPFPPSSPPHDCEGIDYSDFVSFLGNGVCDDGVRGIYLNCIEMRCDDGDCGRCECDNTCEYASNGECDDGGIGADYNFCSIGTSITFHLVILVSK